MTTGDNIHSMGPRTVHFTVDGRRHKTKDPAQTAGEILILAGLDPSRYDLGELRPGNHEPVHFADNDTVHITHKARFVSIRHCADVA